MFRSTTIIRELTYEPSQSNFIKLVKVRRYGLLPVNKCDFSSRLTCKLPDDGRRTKHVGAVLI